MKRNRDEIGGRIDEAAGFVKEHIGRATGNADLEEQGVADRTAGNFRAGVGKVERKIGNVVKDIKDEIDKA